MDRSTSISVAIVGICAIVDSRIPGGTGSRGNTVAACQRQEVTLLSVVNRGMLDRSCETEADNDHQAVADRFPGGRVICVKNSIGPWQLLLPAGQLDLKASAFHLA